MTEGPPPRLGLRENAGQFALLVVVNGFVGAMIGLERTVVPLLAEKEFGVVSRTLLLSFVVGFGVAKALSNLAAGVLSDRVGRKRLLVLGWLFALPVPFLIIFAPSWGWVVFANLLLGVNQGLTWSTTVIMKIDLVGPRRRGLAMGLNESAGYVAVSLVALLSGYLASAYALRPVPFYPGIAFALAGLFLSVFFVRDTRGHSDHEAAQHHPPTDASTFRAVFWRTTWRDRRLFSASQAGLVNNLNDAMVWGLVPVFLAVRGFTLREITVVAAAYPLVWGLGQLVTGAWSDSVGRRPLIVGGMVLQGVSIGLFLVGDSFWLAFAAAVGLGAGTAMAYPSLLASVSDVAHPAWRATSVGVYRFWRDSGYVFGALFAGILADVYGAPVAIGAVAALTVASGLVAALSPETLPRAASSDQPA